jgi:putative oxidoreductase
MRFASPLLFAIGRFYQFFIKIGSNLQSLFLLYMRLTWGHQFILAGWGKLHAIEWTAQYFESLDIHHPHFFAYAVGWIELLGGSALFIGLASRLASVSLIAITLTAIGTAHAKDISNFRFLFEPLSLVHLPPYPYLITALLAFIFGPGRISLDAWIKLCSERWRKY